LAGIYFLLGGARSGKSEYAENLACQLINGALGRVLYFATATIVDEEMKKRVQLHKSRRPANWKTIEIDKNLILFDDIKKIMDEAVVQKYDVLVIDCITNLLFRLVYKYGLDSLEVIENALERKIEKDVMDFFDNFIGLMCGACGKTAKDFLSGGLNPIINPIQTSADTRQSSADSRTDYKKSIAPGAERKSNLNIIIVSNEVGLGLVPPYPFGRIFRDFLGLINKKIASVSDEVFFFVAGLKLKIK